MKKRVLSTVLVICMLCALFPVSILTASAETFSGSWGVQLAWKLDTATGVLEITGTGEMTNAPPPWSSYRDSIKSVIIGNGVTDIGYYAFVGCTNLTGVTIPNSVTSIGIYAFYNCTGLTSITIPNSVTSIDYAAFEGCTGLTSITIPDSVTSIGFGAFYWCTGLTSVTIPNSVTSIGNYAFSWCTGLTSVTIPNSVKSIGDYAFADCTGLTSITIPDSVTSIGGAAFSGCTGLTSISVSDGNPSYDSRNDCNGIIETATNTLIAGCKNTTIPNSVTSIGDYAFRNCTGLTSITIPDSVTSIGEEAFYKCTGLTSISVSDGNPSYDSRNDCNGIIETGTNTLIAGCKNTTIPNSVTSIGDYAFADCTGLTSITIPDSVTSIGHWAFSGCTSLQSVCFLGDAPMLGQSAFQMWDEEVWKYINIPGLTLYYIEGKEGWISPTCQGYPTATWDGVNLPYIDIQPTIEFVDVPQKAWYVEAVNYAVRNGLMNGVGNDQFAPEGSMTRAMLVTVMWRYDGQFTGYKNTFTDVDEQSGSWYVDAVAWASAEGVVNGIGDGRFGPNGNITREQMATILFRYAEKKGIDTSKRGDLSGFPDANTVSDYASEAIQWAVAEGIINGSDGKLLPQGNATRAQVSAILMRFIENVIE